ncbi:ring-cleaving dioxygenase [Halomarina halobia]|uniref:Ring-cleaving dioxygenase n=1 Tax=Halomarina halobia TaxID=3033386 RepID=A0ABD6A999_9EURY|nr:ring-cleaving dioxygenase [Halomarina sp. PSR21]
MTIRGLHHVTAFTESLDRNLAFYRDLLGLRLVKQTVATDDPYAHHLYYGNGTGAPGTILTFSPWSDADDVEQPTTGEVTAFGFVVPPQSHGYWIDRLRAHGVEVTRGERFDLPVLSFTDPDGLSLELVAVDGGVEPWTGGSVPTTEAVRGLFGVTVAVEDPEATARFVEDSLGYALDGTDGDRLRYRSVGRVGSVLDIVRRVETGPAPVGPGHVHHVAFRVESAAEQAELGEAIAALGTNVSPVVDRRYFRSLYFREPGGCAFELATDDPGFTVDEEPSELGRELMLPVWLEDRREDVEAHLSPFPAERGTADAD